MWKNGSYTLYDAYPDADIGRTTQQGLLKAIAKAHLLGEPDQDYQAEQHRQRECHDQYAPGRHGLLRPERHGCGHGLRRTGSATFPGRGDVTYRGRDWVLPVRQARFPGDHQHFAQPIHHPCDRGHGGHDSSKEIKKERLQKCSRSFYT